MVVFVGCTIVVALYWEDTKYEFCFTICMGVTKVSFLQLPILNKLAQSSQVQNSVMNSKHVSCIRHDNMITYMQYDNI